MQQIGVRPMRNENRVVEPSRVRHVLNDMQMRLRMGKIVGHDPNKENALGNSKADGHAAG